MIYKTERNRHYDFVDETYRSVFPNLHKYPATMLPQIGIELLKEFNITNGSLLDPYCGSGSSFSAGLDLNFKSMIGFDLNPLAILISSAKFSISEPKRLYKHLEFLKNSLYESAKHDFKNISFTIPECKNIDFWFSNDVQTRLAVIYYYLNQLKDNELIFKVAFSETVRDTSYTRNGEFKLYKMKEENILRFNPDVLSIFLDKCKRNIKYYIDFYLPKLNNIDINIYNHSLNINNIPSTVDVVLTSPPYGDSKTTVAYGQFSNFSNEWLGYKDARSLDKTLMGGQINKIIYTKGYIANYINKINNICHKRSLEVSSFYFDLEDSIKEVAKTIKIKGHAIYIMGNRSVKKVILPTDQFVAEQFESHGFSHIKTYKRAISNKVMPTRNSPTNKVGETVNTMNYEYIVICRKKHD